VEVISMTLGLLPSRGLLGLLLSLLAAGTIFGEEKKQDGGDEVAITAGWNGSHPFIRSADGAFEMEFGGRMHLDFRAYTADFAPQDTFLVRRARLEASGVLYEVFELKVQADFADQESTLLRDGYLNVHAKDIVQVMAGQFKAPFSQEEQESSRFIGFVERSMLNNIVPSRSPGVLVHGQTAKEVFQYAVSLQNDNGELGVNQTSRPDVFGRARFKPFTSGAFENLRFGGAFGAGERDENRFVRGRTSSRSVVFSERVPLKGDLTRGNLEAWWNHRNFLVQAEYDYLRGERFGLGEDGSDIPDIVAKGFMIQGLYVVTGETKTGGPIEPKNPFHEGGPGAWEVGFRYQFFDIEDRNRASDITFGVNWWLNKFVRFQANVSRESFRAPPDPSTGETTNYALLSRLGVYF